MTILNEKEEKLIMMFDGTLLQFPKTPEELAQVTILNARKESERWIENEKAKIEIYRNEYINRNPIRKLIRFLTEKY